MSHGSYLEVTCLHGPWMRPRGVLGPSENRTKGFSLFTSLRSAWGGDCGNGYGGVSGGCFVECRPVGGDTPLLVTMVVRWGQGGGCPEG